MAKTRMLASAFKLPDEMRSRLQRLAKKAGRSASEEVRRRLEASFAREHEIAADPKMAALQDRIGLLADTIQAFTGGAEWHSNPYAYEVLRTGMLALLEAAGRPAGEVVPPAGSVLTPNNDPETLGRTLARVVSEKAKALARGQSFEFDFRV